MRTAKEERQVIPRWHSFAAASRRGELNSLDLQSTRTVADEVYELETRRIDWETNRGRHIAADLVGSAVVLDRPDFALDAAEFLLRLPNLPESTYAVARRVLDPDAIAMYEPDSGNSDLETDRKLVQERIRGLRRRLRNDPRNAIGWADLALEYAVLGQATNAEEKMVMALRLAPDNRFILRSATRMFLHINEVDRAHWLLRTSPATGSDPWLMAAEVAVASITERKPQLWKRARSVLRSEVFSPWHTNELASAVATVELDTGADRSAKRLFRKSLVDPTENSIAQAEWASQRLSNFSLGAQYLETPYTYEARARHYSEEGLFAEAIEEAWRWFFDQPFDDDAAAFGTYVASVCLEDYQTSIDFALRGLVSNPRSVVIRNNLIFSLASLNQLDEAEEELKKMPPVGALGEDDMVAFLATSGLIAFRRKNLSEGRRLYREALGTARRARLKEMEALAAIYLAREELLAHVDSAYDSVQLALEIGKASPSPEIRLWHDALSKSAVSLGGK